MYLNEPTWYEYVSREVFFVYSVSMHFKIIMNKLISWKSVPNINVTLPYWGHHVSVWSSKLTWV